MCKVSTNTQTTPENVSIDTNAKLPPPVAGMHADYDTKNAAMGLAGTSYEPSTFETK